MYWGKPLSVIMIGQQGIHRYTKIRNKEVISRRIYVYSKEKGNSLVSKYYLFNLYLLFCSGSYLSPATECKTAVEHKEEAEIYFSKEIYTL